MRNVSLEDIKAELAKKYDIEKLPDDEYEKFGEIYDKTSLKKLVSWIKSNETIVDAIITEVVISSEYGDYFYEYFSNDEMFEELKNMHNKDVDRFYDIVKSYEMFLNLCAKAAGMNNFIVRIKVSDLLDDK